MVIFQVFTLEKSKIFQNYSLFFCKKAIPVVFYRKYTKKTAVGIMIKNVIRQSLNLAEPVCRFKPVKIKEFRKI